MKYNPNIFNKGVFPRFTSVTVYAKPSYSSDVLYEIKGFAGMTDGNYDCLLYTSDAADEL